MNINQAEILLKTANTLSDAGKHEEANRKLSKLVEIIPNKSVFWTLLGSNLIDLNRFEEAEKALQKALDLDPDYTEAKIALKSVLT